MSDPPASAVRPIVPLAAPPDAWVSIPGSKSLTNRAVLCAALAAGETRLEGALFADDTEAMLDAVEVLGAVVERDEAACTVNISGLGAAGVAGAGVGGADVGGAGVGGAAGVAGAAGGGLVIDARMSGTTGRFVVPVAATGRRSVIIDGRPQLRARPFDDLVDPLRQLGVEVETPASGGSLPMRVTGPMRSGVVHVSSGASSQFLSGLMLAGPLTEAGLTLQLGAAVVSRPYIEMTAAVMRSFGATVELNGSEIRVGAGGYTPVRPYLIEPDASSAGYFLAAAALTGGSVGIDGLGSASLQGDIGFVAVLERMGAAVELSERRVRVRGDQLRNRLRGIAVDLGRISDTAPTLAVVAALADGPTTVSGIGFIRAKESDRIAAVVTELRRCGVAATDQPDGFTVLAGAEPAGARIRSYDDHRIAMAFAVLGLVVEGIEIEDPGCVAKTFPGFFEALDQLR